MPGVAERERKTRDLRSEIAGLQTEFEKDIVFQHIRSGHEPVTLYSVLDGEPIPIPEYMVPNVLTKTLPDGRYMFTDNPDEVPEYKLGDVKCFLHADSPERASGVLDEIGLAGKACPAGHLSSLHSKRMHGHHRHKQEWAAYQEYVEEKKEAVREARQEKQLEATLGIARAAGGQPTPSEEPVAPVAKGVCDTCGKTGLKNVGAHMRGAHNV